MRIANKYEEDVERISNEYKIDEAIAGCYISNYEDRRICHLYGGCKHIKECRKIKENERSE